MGLMTIDMGNLGFTVRHPAGICERATYFRQTLAQIDHISKDVPLLISWTA